MNKDSGIFQDTMDGLDSGLRVRNITTYELATCESDVDIAAVLVDPCLDGFDCIPVRANGVIIGYIRRAGDARGAVREHMRPLEESILVSADLPLRQFVPLIPQASHRLVLDGTSIRGIVTWSDLQKLPIRLYVFSLVTYLEMVMAAVIRSTYFGEEWRTKLSAGRQAKIEEKRQQLRRENFEPPLLELAEFCDKRDILARDPRFGKRFDRELKHIEKLRNSTAHAATYAEDPEAVRAFVQHLQQTKHWIEQLTELLSANNSAT